MYNDMANHSSPTPSNPAKNDLHPLLANTKPTANAPMAIVHQGRKAWRSQLMKKMNMVCTMNFILKPVGSYQLAVGNVSAT